MTLNLLTTPEASIPYATSVAFFHLCGSWNNNYEQVSLCLGICANSVEICRSLQVIISLHVRSAKCALRTLFPNPPFVPLSRQKSSQDIDKDMCWIVKWDLCGDLRKPQFDGLFQSPWNWLTFGNSCCRITLQTKQEIISIFKS